MRFSIFLGEKFEYEIYVLLQYKMVRSPVRNYA